VLEFQHRFKIVDRMKYSAINLISEASSVEPLIFSSLALMMILLIMIAIAGFIVMRYRRCGPNQLMVIYGRVAGDRAAKVLHGGGTFVWPVVQDYAYLSLDPLIVDIDLPGLLTKDERRIDFSATVTAGISSDPEIMYNAAERLIGLDTDAVRAVAREVIIGQFKRAISTLAAEQISKDNEAFLDQVKDIVNSDLNRVGMDILGVNVRQIS